MCGFTEKRGSHQLHTGDERRMQNHGSRGYTRDDILEVIHNLANKKPHVTQIITHTFPLDDAVEAFETASDPSLAIKVVLDLA